MRVPEGCKRVIKTLSDDRVEPWRDGGAKNPKSDGAADRKAVRIARPRKFKLGVTHEF